MVSLLKQSTLEHEDGTQPDLPQLDCQLNDITLSVSELSNIIRNLYIYILGPDQVHNRLLTVAFLVTAEPLNELFNRSLLVKASSLLFGKFLTLAPGRKRGPRSFVTTIAQFLC